MERGRWVVLVGVIWAMVQPLPTAVLAAGGGDFSTPHTLVAEIYREVSRAGGSTPDWERVRSFFDPHAVIVLRATRTETRRMDVDAFIEDFVAFYDRLGPGVEFKETVVATKMTEYGNVAHCFVVYEAAVEGREGPPPRGLDSWHLQYRDQRWWVVSVINESESVAGPIPVSAIGE